MIYFVYHSNTLIKQLTSFRYHEDFQGFSRGTMSFRKKIRCGSPAPGRQAPVCVREFQGNGLSSPSVTTSPHKIGINGYLKLIEMKIYI